jgi:inosine-uridine nucleoside N-ribohydrolase
MIDRRLLLTAPLGLAALSSVAQASPHWFGRQRTPVIFHTDIGYDVDDTWALLMLLRSPELDLKLVVCDVENTTYRARVAAKLLHLGGRRDVVVATGPKAGDEPGPQSAWVGDFTLNTYGGPVRRDGAQAIVDTIMASPRAVTVISTGPATLLAAALQIEPRIASKARFVGMDGSIRVGYGGSPKPEIEYNVKTDPLALRAVFAAPWPCAITPLDTCGTFILDGADYQTVLKSNDPFARAAIENSRDWLPHAPWMGKDYDLSQHSSTLYDAVAVIMAYDDSDLVMETLPIFVRDDGMTVIDAAAGRPVRCATAWRDMAGMKHKLAKRLTL